MNYQRGRSSSTVQIWKHAPTSILWCGKIGVSGKKNVPEDIETPTVFQSRMHTGGFSLVQGFYIVLLFTGIYYMIFDEKDLYFQGI